MRSRTEIIDIDDVSYTSQRLLDLQCDKGIKSLEEIFNCKVFFNKESEKFVFIKGNDVVEVKDIDYIMKDQDGNLRSRKYTQQNELPNYSTEEIEDLWNDCLEEKEEEKSFSINQKIYSFSKFFMRKYYSSESGWKFYNKIYNLLPGDFKYKMPFTDTDFMWIADRLQNVFNKEEKIKFIVELDL
jgi:hypothetical protein